MNDLEILAEAISDVGVWTWWQSDSPEYIQIEFNGTQLWNPPTEAGHPPSGEIALGFEDVVSVAFLTFDSEAAEENWPQLFHEDQIDHFNLNSERFTLLPVYFETTHKEPNHESLSTYHGRHHAIRRFGYRDCRQRIAVGWR